MASKKEKIQSNTAYIMLGRSDLNVLTGWVS